MRLKPVIYSVSAFALGMALAWYGGMDFFARGVHQAIIILLVIYCAVSTYVLTGGRL